MILKLDNSMKLVFDLKVYNEKEPYLMRMYQRATLDKNKNNIGLSGKYGLYGTEEWWGNIHKGLIKTEEVSGVIVNTYVDGQHDGLDNTFKLKLTNGNIIDCPILILDENDRELFKKNHQVKVLFAFDERKLQPAENGEINFASIIIEAAVSYEATKNIFRKLFDRK